MLRMEGSGITQIRFFAKNSYIYSFLSWRSFLCENFGYLIASLSVFSYSRLVVMLIMESRESDRFINKTSSSSCFIFTD
jgi:hypothetical protein